MSSHEYDYTIARDNSPKKFKEACAEIERRYPDYEKLKLAVDVDGTTIQVYEKDGREIVVFDDYEVGAVFVESDFELSHLLPKPQNRRVAAVTPAPKLAAVG